MGKKDVTWRDYFKDNRRYADIINGIACDGHQIVLQEDLVELNSKAKQKFRDEDAYEVVEKYANIKEGTVKMEEYKGKDGKVDVCKGIYEGMKDLQ